MSATYDSGPAFPVIGAAGSQEDYGGMSLRDYFAAKAMQGFAADGADTWPSAEELAHDAYRLADAMLAVRAK